MKDARKVFDDMESKQNPHPLYIAGLDQAEEVLSALIKNTSLENSFIKCKELGKLMHLDLKPLFYKIYGDFSREYKGQYVKRR